MIQVEVAPPPPLALGHLDEDRVRRPDNISRRLREAVEQSAEVRQVALELDRPGAPSSWSISGLVLTPCGQEYGKYKAVHLNTVR